MPSSGPDGAGQGRPARVFFALWPPEAVRRQLAEVQAQWRWPPRSARVAPQRLHLTLHFLAAVSPATLAALRAHPGVACAPFTLRLDQAGCWDRAGIAWLQPGEVPDALQLLHRQLAGVLRELDLPVAPRPFAPHVTLARHARGAVPPAAWPAVSWPVAGYALVESVRGAQPGYRVLAQWPGSAGFNPA